MVPTTFVNDARVMAKGQVTIPKKSEKFLALKVETV